MVSTGKFLSYIILYSTSILLIYIANCRKLITTSALFGERAWFGLVTHVGSDIRLDTVRPELGPPRVSCCQFPLFLYFPISNNCDYRCMSLVVDILDKRKKKKRE